MHRDFKPTSSYDAFWIFTLWRAMHGGDATLADIAAAVIANLSQFLPAREDSFEVAPLPASPYLLTVMEMQEYDYADNNSTDLAEQSDSEESQELFCCDPSDFSIHHNYFKFKGVFYRIDRPAFACLSTAA